MPLVRCRSTIYAGDMRYPDGGGLSPAARGRRETVRLQAARLFAEDVAPVQVAARLRVSPKSIYQWRRCWRAGGEAALASTGPGGARCRLSDAQLDRLRTELERGPAEHGWADQRWTLARVATLIGRLFHLRYTPRGTAYLLHRMGWSWQVPRHRAAERNEDAVAEWRTLTWAKVRGWRRRPGRGSSSRTRPGPPCVRRRRAPGLDAGVPRRLRCPVGVGGCRWPRWSATGPATAAGCSTESWCIAAAPASGAASPKMTTPR